MRISRHGWLLLAPLILIAVMPSTALGAALVPDIQTRDLPTGLDDPDIVDDGSGGHELVFSNGWANHGHGPWETAPIGTAAADDCDSDGIPSNDALVGQRTFQDANGDGVFQRGIDTGFTVEPAGCMIFHPAHGHFHVEDAGLYSLLAEPSGLPAGASHKVSFCLLDVGQFDGLLPGAPSSSFYDTCSEGMQGISVGWFDEYGYYLAGQEIGLNPGLPAGTYCLRSQFDPESRFREANEANNLSEQRYDIGYDGTSDSYSISALPPGECDVPDSPDTTITAGPAPGSADIDPTPVLAFESTDPFSSLECRVDYGEWAPCVSPHTTESLTAGDHVFLARAVGPVGFDDTPATRSFTVGAPPPVDKTPPETKITGGPDGKTSDRTPKFRFRADEPATFECRRDARRWRACFSPWTLRPLPAGGHRFRVRATDLAGNIEDKPATQRFRVALGG